MPPMPGLFEAPKPPPVPPPPPKRDPPVEGVVVEPKAGLEPEPKSVVPDPNEEVLVVLAVLPDPKPPNPPVVPVFVFEEPKRPPPVPVAGEPNAGLLPKPLLCCVFEPNPT